MNPERWQKVQEIFHAALRSAGVAANQAVHVGDSIEEDVSGAEAAGMSAVLLNRHEGEGTGLRDLRDLWTRLEAA